jgi:hypothetical protein
VREGGPIRFHRDFPSTSPVLLPRGWAEKREEERRREKRRGEERRGEERRGQERRGDKRRAWYWYWFCHFCSSVQTPTMGCSACVAASCCCHRAQNRAANIHPVVWRTRKEENINNDVHAKVTYNADVVQMLYKIHSNPRVTLTRERQRVSRH